jgi:hypothetical protein
MDLSNKVLKHISGDIITPLKRLHGWNRNKETEFYLCSVIKDSGELLEDFVFPVDNLHLMYTFQELTIEGECYE